MIQTEKERIKAQRDKTPAQILQELFDYSHYIEPESVAFVLVSYRGINGNNYGSYRHLKESFYKEHETRVSQDHTNAIHVEVLDMLFDPKANKHIDVDKSIK